MNAFRARWIREGSLNPPVGAVGIAWPLPHPSPQEEGSWAFWQQGVAWYCAPERDLELLEPTAHPWRVGLKTRVRKPLPGVVVGLHESEKWGWPRRVDIAPDSGGRLLTIAIEEVVTEEAHENV